MLAYARCPWVLWAAIEWGRQMSDIRVAVIDDWQNILTLPCGEVIQHTYIHFLEDQFLYDVRSDEPCATSY